MILQNNQKNLNNGAVIVAITLASLLLWPGLFKNLLAANGFMPHGHCYLWKPELVGLHLTSDTLIALAYVAISTTLGYLVYKTRQEIPFHWMFLAFGSFILACGSTHLMAVWTLWHPNYWLSGGMKLITAIASVTTAVILPSLVPKALALVEAAKLSEERRLNLENANLELETLYDKLKQLDNIKSQFFANVSHELRTPLALILGPTQRLQKSESLNEAQRRDVEVMDRNARILLKHVNDLLDISKLEAGKMGLNYADIDLAQMLRLSAANFEGVAVERQISLTVETPEFLHARIDAEKLQRVVLNLLSNAFKFTPQGGRIRCILSAQPMERIAIAIQDTGPGVPSELRETIFERFRQGESGTTRRFGGTGLGLAIVKDFVNLHGGTVEISDAPGGGAIFTVSLPLVAPSEIPSATTMAESLNTEEIAFPLVQELLPATGALALSDLQEADKPLILIVEDNPQMNEFLAETLAAQYRIAIAFDGEEGLNQALTLHPDLIVTDVMMPRMSGEQLVRQLRTHREFDATPIVVLTAKADDDLRVRLLFEGAQDYLMKPFSIEELQARVGNHIAIKRSRDFLQKELSSQSQDLQILTLEVALSRRELQKAVEALQQQAEELERANHLKDEFLKIVSHELRTPLNSILGWAQLMRSQKLNETIVSKALETIERNAKQQVKVIDDILDVSLIIRGKIRLNIEPVNLVEIVEETIETFLQAAIAKNIEIVKTFRETSVQNALSYGQFNGDRDRLLQIVWNLLSNALKFTPSGGRVEVELSRNDSCVQLRVNDTGIGISPEFLPHVFEGFRQAEISTIRTHGGLGLGLTIVRYLVELHGGTVQAFSQGQDKGATFIVKLPVASPKSIEKPSNPAEISHQGLSNYLWSLDGLRVLVVDDDPDTCDLIATVLAQYGVNVTTVSSAHQALEAIADLKPDILVSDIGMPGENGYQLIRKVRELEAEGGGKIPAVALTGFAREEDRRKAIQAGFQMHVPKPVEPAHLATVVATLVSQTQSRSRRSPGNG